MKKVKLRHILLSLIFGIAASVMWSWPILQDIHKKALLTTQEDVEGIYRELNVALINKDIVGLQKLLADGFQFETSRGEFISKKEWIQNIQSGKMRYSLFSKNEVTAIGRNSASVSSIIMGEIWENRDTWKVVLHLEIVRKGKNIQIQRLISKSICEMNVHGLFEHNCRGRSE